MDEAAARRIVLAQAIEGADARQSLVSRIELEQIGDTAAEAARRSGEPGSVATIRQFLERRAALVLQAVAKRDAAVASLQDRHAGERWITAGIPLTALLLGVLTDQVANPHQVNLLSKPLLLLLLWNLVVYAVLLAGLVARREPTGKPRFAGVRPWLGAMREWLRRPGHLRSEITGTFLMQWHTLTAPLDAQRLTRVLHLAAAAWALGVALSLFFGGVWASYGVQWESTFLSATDVHRFLSVLFGPVTALFPWASFSLEEIRGLRAAGALPSPPADAADNFSGRRWVFLYAMLLAMVIVLPRMLLAAVAWWREKTLSRMVPLDLSQPYFQRLIAQLSPARIQLCIVAHRGEDRAALLRVLLHRVDGALPGVRLGQGELHALLEGPGGEVLRVLDLASVDDPARLQQAQQQSQRQASGGWTDRVMGTVIGAVFGKGKPVAAVAPGPLETVRDESDVVLHVVRDARDVEAGAALLAWLDKPVLVLVNGSAEGSPPRALRFEEFARCWVQEPVLLDAIGRLLPAYKTTGFARLADAWQERNLAWLRESMSAIAWHLLGAAAQVEEVGKAPRSLVSLVRGGERDAHERRSREAMATVLARLRESDAQATSSLLVLHGIEPSSALALNHRLEEKFVRQDAISATQAGMAGAATGAAMGVSIDLLTAGLTLGLAAAAGAVVGGGAAWVAAVWRNQATPAGNPVVQLSDEMLQAMVEAALLRYLAVIHFGRGRFSDAAGGEIRPEWRSEVVAAVERRSEDLKQQWAAARAGHRSLEPTAALVSMLESIALAVLKRLYPGPPSSPSSGSPGP